MAVPSDHVIIGNLPEDIDEEAFRTNFEAYGTIKWCKLFSGKGGGSKKSGMIEFSSVDEATWLVENLDGNVPLGLETEVSVKYKTAGKAGGAAVSGGKGAGAGGKGAAVGGKGAPYGGKNRYEPYGGGGFGGGGLVPNSKGGGKMGQMMQFMGLMGKGGMGGKGGQTSSSMVDLWKGLLRHKMLPGGTWANDERTALVSGLPSDTTEFDVLKIFSTFGAVLPGGIRVTLNDDGTAKGNAMVNFREIESTKAAIETLDNCMLPDGAMLRVRNFSDWGKGKAKGGGKGKGGKAGPKPEAEAEA